jgi:hypothetical protein
VVVPVAASEDPPKDDDRYRLDPLPGLVPDPLGLGGVLGLVGLVVELVGLVVGLGGGEVGVGSTPPTPMTRVGVTEAWPNLLAARTSIG